MARGLHLLSAIQVAKLKDAGLHADGGGLYLQIGPTGAKSWLFRYKVEGKQRKMGLGPVADVTLAEARRKAEVCRKQRVEQIDPLEARAGARVAEAVAAAKAMTFEQCAEAYIQAHEPSWKNPKHRQQWRNTLKTYVYPILGNLPVGEIDLALVVKVLEPIWASKPETASRIRGRIEVILSWATVSGHRQGDNPALWKGRLEHRFPARAKMRKVSHHTALPYEAMPSFWSDLEKQTATSAIALKLCILTATRTGEALGARWAEIDLKSATWTIPADRMKAGREHRVPLSTPAVQLLEQHQTDQSGAYVFPGQSLKTPLSQMAMLMLLRRMKREDLTVHGFRSTFRDWAGGPGRAADPRSPAGRSALYSLAFMMRRAAAVYLDIQDYELKAGIRSQEDPALGSVVGQIFLCDTLENGAGYATHLGEPAVSEQLLQMIVQNSRWQFHDRLVDQAHAGACDTSCPDCLRSYSNLAYHNLLDWRLAIDMANLALDANSAISLSSPLWARVADLAAATLEAARPGFSRTTFGGISGLTNGREAIIVTHPLWLTDRAGAGPEIAAAWDDAERARSLRVDPAWSFISVFEALRRPA